MNLESKFYALKQEIINTHLCTGCGGCIAVCPAQCLQMENIIPSMLPEDFKEIQMNCTNCTLCYNFCPRIDLHNEFISEIEGTLNRGNVIAAQTLDESVKTQCQDGGVVTTLLKCLFEEHLIDGAVVSKYDSSWKPIPTIIKSAEELKGSSGTRYSVSPNLSVLKPKTLMELIIPPFNDINKLRLAFIGTPCQILAIRKMQMHPVNAPIYPSNIS